MSGETLEKTTISEKGTNPSLVLVIEDDEEHAPVTAEKSFIDLTKGYGPSIVDLTLDNSPVVAPHDQPAASRATRRNFQSELEFTAEESSECLNKNKDSPTKTIKCPICMEDSKQMARTNRQLVSTICGHVFCESCLKQAMKQQKKCPTCRRTITSKQFHPLYI
eukprot:gene5312-5982_t